MSCTKKFIHQFILFQESLRDKNGFHRIYSFHSLYEKNSQGNYKTDKILMLEKEINQALKNLASYESIKSASTFTDKEKKIHQTIFVLLSGALLSPYFCQNIPPVDLNKKINSFLINPIQPHAATLTYIFYQLSILNISVYSLLFATSHRIYENSTFSLKEHKYMQDIFSTIHSVTIIENLKFIHDNPKDYLTNIDNPLSGCFNFSVQKYKHFLLDFFNAAQNIIKKLGLSNIDKNLASIINSFHHFFYLNLTSHWIKNDTNIIKQSLEDSQKTIYSDFFRSLLSTHPTNLSKIFFFPLLEMNQSCNITFILNGTSGLLKNIRYIQDLILSSEDPENPVKLIDLLFALPPESLLLLFEIEKNLTEDFRKIFLYALAKAFINFLNHEKNTEEVKKILIPLSKYISLLNNLSLEHKTEFFNSLSIFFCNLEDEISLLIWPLLMNIDQKYKSSYFIPILTRYLIIITNNKKIFPSSDELFNLMEAINLTRENECLTLYNTLKKGKVTQNIDKAKRSESASNEIRLKELEEKTQTLEAKIKILDLELKTAKSNLDLSITRELMFKNEVVQLNKSIIQTKKDYKDLLSSLEQQTKKTEIDVAQKHALLEQKMANIQENGRLVDQKLQELQKKATTLVISFLRSHHILCFINQVSIIRPCLVTDDGQKQIPGAGNLS